MLRKTVVGVMMASMLGIGLVACQGSTCAGAETLDYSSAVFTAPQRGSSGGSSGSTSHAPSVNGSKSGSSSSRSSGSGSSSGSSSSKTARGGANNAPTFNGSKTGPRSGAPTFNGSKSSGSFTGSSSHYSGPKTVTRHYSVTEPNGTHVVFVYHSHSYYTHVHVHDPYDIYDPFNFNNPASPYFQTRVMVPC